MVGFGPMNLADIPRFDLAKGVAKAGAIMWIVNIGLQTSKLRIANKDTGPGYKLADWDLYDPKVYSLAVARGTKGSDGPMGKRGLGRLTARERVYSRYTMVTTAGDGRGLWEIVIPATIVRDRPFTMVGYVIDTVTAAATKTSLMRASYIEVGPSTDLSKLGFVEGPNVSTGAIRPLIEQQARSVGSLYSRALPPNLAVGKFTTSVFHTTLHLQSEDARLLLIGTPGTSVDAAIGATSNAIRICFDQ